MNIEKAFKELMAGKKIRRKEWEPFMHLRLVEKVVMAFKSETTISLLGPDILNTTGWKVVDGDGASMSFIEALEPLKAKKYLSHEEMGENTYLFVDNGEFAKCMPIPYSFMPTFHCLCANDWEVLK